MIRSPLPIALAGLLAVSLAATGADDEQIAAMAVSGEVSAPVPVSAAVVEPRPATWRPALRELAAATAQGNRDLARRLAGQLPTDLSPREVDAVRLVDALAAAADGDADTADLRLREVADADGPLAPWATFHRAELALERGDPLVSIDACAAYAAAWPGATHADLCHAVTARAWASLGRADEAMAEAEAWRRLHPREDLTEGLELQLALGDPEGHAELLGRLSTRFRAALTGHRAADALTAAGLPIPGDAAALRDRAESLVEAGAAEEAWEVFLQVAREADPESMAWVARNRTSFAWKARAWTDLEAGYRASWAASPDADVAWDAWRAASRGGLYVDARRWMQEGLARWPGRSPWRDNHESFARTLLLGGWPAEAAALLDPTAGDSGGVARRRLFLASFARYRAGDHTAAGEGFTRLISRPGPYEVEARYWRARTLAEVDPFTADADRAWVLAHDPDGWYAVLLRAGTSQPGRAHRGVWPAPAPTWWPSVPPAPELGLPRHAALAGGHELIPAPWRPPLGYPEGPYHDPEAGQALLDRLATEFGPRWPVLEAIADLARVGLHDLSGPLMAEWNGEWRRALGRRDPTARRLAAEIGDGGLLPAFIAARDHHQTARRTWLLDRQVSDPGERDATLRLAWPVAHGAVVWDAARRDNLDPWLVLGLMRAESTYNPVAVSRAGARGPMQIMPRTGHLLADRFDDPTFTTSHLYDPAVAVDFGIRYLGLLQQRFDGAFPLAVAAYNAGPHNVGAWLDGLGAGSPVDELVEAIPFVETRDYVRRVTAYYDAYTRLYEGTGVRVPLQTRPQDRDVVDF